MFCIANDHCYYLHRSSLITHKLLNKVFELDLEYVVIVTYSHINSLGNIWRNRQDSNLYINTIHYITLYNVMGLGEKRENGSSITHHISY